MLKLSILATALPLGMCLLITGCNGTKTTVETPEEALAVAIKLLEAKDGTEYVKRFMPPAQLEMMKQRHETDEDEIANQLLPPDRAESSLQQLKLVKDSKAEYDNTRTRAKFSAKNQDGELVEVTFKLIEEKWRLY